MTDPWLFELQNDPFIEVLHVRRDWWEKMCDVVHAAEYRFGNNPIEDKQKSDWLDEKITELRALVEK